MSAKFLMSLVTRHVARNVRHVSTSSHVMATYRVQTKGEFLDKVTNSDKPVVVNFPAEWFDICRNLLPRIGAGILMD